MAKVFSLEGRGLKLDTADDLHAHIQPLLASQDHTEIRLNGNTIGVPASVALADVLRTQKALRTANLADVFTSRLLSEIPAALSALLTALLELPELRTVDLSDNAFGLNTVEPLRPFLARHVPLQHLILNNNGLGPAAGTLVAEALTELAARKAEARKAGGDDKEVPELETVVCGRNRLENGSMKAWAAAFRANAGVREVRMVQNGVRQEGIVTLLRDGLGACSRLERLDLQDNTFTVPGSLALAEVVVAGKWEALTDLGVGDCLLSGRGGLRVLEALGQGKTRKLEVLRLQYNEVDAKGLKALVGALEELPGLRRVELNGNKFDGEDVSLVEIREALDKRRQGAGEGEDDERWGIDELDDLEEEDSEDEAEDDGEEEEEGEKVLKEADAAEEQPVAADKDHEVDELASKLGKTGI